jgi:hypothetical protein
MEEPFVREGLAHRGNDAVSHYREFLAARRELLAQAENTFLDNLFTGSVPEATLIPGGLESEVAHDSLASILTPGMGSASGHTAITKYLIRFCTGTHPTENFKLLINEVTERLAGIEGGTTMYRLKTGFGRGQSPALITAVHVACDRGLLAELLVDYHIQCFSEPSTAWVAGFVGEESYPPEHWVSPSRNVGRSGHHGITPSNY